MDISRLWTLARAASIPWLLVALALYLVMILISAWRWTLLLGAQHVQVPFGTLVQSYLVATFFNNFLPSNIGGDVVRIRDTAPHAGSKTTATMIVLVDRGIGLLGLIFVAARRGRRSPLAGANTSAQSARACSGGCSPARSSWPSRRCSSPTASRRCCDRSARFIRSGSRSGIERLTTALAKFRDAKGALLNGFIASVLVQAILVGFYASIAQALHVTAPVEHIAVVVPLSFIVQMLPVSVNGFGVREATFGYYFTRFGEPLETALALSFVGAALIMLFSVSGAVVESHPPPRPAGGGTPGSAPGGPYMNVICRNAPR